MTTTTALTKPITPDTWSLIQAVAPAAHASRLFGTASPEQAMLIMLYGHELGLPITAAFGNIYLIDGKLSIAPKLALGLIYQSGLLTKLDIQEQPNACTVTIQRRGQQPYTLTYTLDQAKRAGVVKPGSGWDKYEANMLRWRAIGFCSDIVFPDVIAGLSRADEFGAVIDVEGNVVEVPNHE
jgi:hypothetical protein